MAPAVAQKPDAQPRARKPRPPPTAASLANLAPPFQPGNNANPGGRPKTPPELRLAALRAAPDALQVAIGIVQSAKAAQDAAADASLPAHVHRHSEQHTRWAVDTVLDRALGRAEQAVHVTGDGAARLPLDVDAAALAALLELVREARARRTAIDVTPTPPQPENT